MQYLSDILKNKSIMKSMINTRQNNQIWLQIPVLSLNSCMFKDNFLNVFYPIFLHL